MYVRAYERAELSNGEPIPPINWELNRTSSWLNFFLGRDHSATRLGIPKIDRKNEKG
jgi:methylenetetrahydrofolate reductase (NADPH)